MNFKLNIFLFLVFFFLVAGIISGNASHQVEESERPNIIYILADDLGYGELGVYGQEKIETPNLDRLAQNGMKFTNHYSGSPVCASTRYNLLTGKHPGHSYIRGNSEMSERGDVWNFNAMYENTIIMFSSDNSPVEGYGVDPEYFDSAALFLGTRGWGKGMLHEGGIRVPMIATWEGQIEAGSTTDHLSAFWDITPTFSELAGIEPPAEIDGVSFLPVLLGDEQNQEQHDYLYWEFPGRGGQQAVRMDNWKGLRKNIISEGNLEIELFRASSKSQS